MENTKKTKEQKELEKEQRKIEKHLKFMDNHFVYVVTVDDVTTEIPLNGTWDNMGIVFTDDSNGYIGVVNDGNNGSFIKEYTRCKETSKKYYLKSKLVASNQKYMYSVISNAITEENGRIMTFSEIFEKAQRIYKQTKTKRVNEDPG